MEVQQSRSSLLTVLMTEERRCKGRHIRLFLTNTAMEVEEMIDEMQRLVLLRYYQRNKEGKVLETFDRCIGSEPSRRINIYRRS